MLLRSYSTKRLATLPKSGGGMRKEKIVAKKSKRQVSRRPVLTPAARDEFNPDYTNVKKDLKTIGSLAGFFVAVLVILTFFLR